MSAGRVLLLTHESSVPRRASCASAQRSLIWKTEADLQDALEELGHDVETLGIGASIEPLRASLSERPPKVVVNQLMQVGDEGRFEPHVAGYLELHRVPFTGCDAPGLLKAGDKVLSKQILSWEGIPTPEFAVYPMSRRASSSSVPFPAIVKPVDRGCSVGIARSSVVSNVRAMRARIDFLHESLGCDVIVERYIDGRDLTVGVLGNGRLTTLPVWETFYPKELEPKIATERLKWHLGHRAAVGVRTGPARLREPVARRIQKLARETYRALELSGYARIDVRLARTGEPFVLEANPNPDLDFDEDFVRSAARIGLAPVDVVRRVVRLALNRP